MPGFARQKSLSFAFVFSFPVIIFFSCLLAGCMSFAIRLSSSIFDDFPRAFLQECDPQLAKEAIPGQLKLAEALLLEDPNNRRILSSLCMGYTGYALLFVEQSQPKRASKLYLRALSYGFKAVGVTQEIIETGNIHGLVEKLNNSEVDDIFWSSVAWLRWISLNLDDPSSLAQLPLAITSLKYVMKKAPRYLHGIPYAIMGCVLTFQGSSLGSHLELARDNFEKALIISKRKVYLIQFLYARYYAVATQDRSLFRNLLAEIINGASQGPRDVCLINQVMRTQAQDLLRNIDDLFI